MQSKKVMCPKCGAVLGVKNSKNELLKQINCPQCHSLLQVRFESQQQPLEARTFLNVQRPVPTVNGKTQLTGGVQGTTQLSVPKQRKSATANILYNGKIYQLEEGQNIVGRKGKTSMATMQIETDDRYMSRQHCSITVTTLPNGTKKAVLSNYQNKNLTSVDGHEIETGDAIRLTDGNSIKMGHSILIFKLS